MLLNPLSKARGIAPRPLEVRVRSKVAILDIAIRVFHLLAYRAVDLEERKVIVAKRLPAFHAVTVFCVSHIICSF